MARIRFVLEMALALAVLMPPVLTLGDTDATAIIIGWGFGVDPGSASTNLAQWKAEEPMLSNLLILQPGYPKIQTNAKVPELKPGAHAVILGICPPEQAEELIVELRGIGTSVWKKESKRHGIEFACPQEIGGWKYQQRVSLNENESHLVGAVFSKKDPESGLLQSFAHLNLRDSQLVLLDFKEIAFPAGCTATLSTDVGVIRIEKTCTGPGAPPKELLRIAAVNGKIGPAPELGQLAEVQAVLWESAATPAASQEALERWQREKAAVEGILELPAGYPKVVASDGYPGLAPGSQVVLLGVCPAARLTEPMKVLKAFRPQVLAKKVKLSSGEPDCPKLIANLAVSHVEQLDAKPYRLTAVLHGRSNYLWDLRLYLRDAQGTLLDWRREDGRTLGILGRPSGECTDATLQPDFSSPSSGSGRIAVDAQCRTTDEVSSRGFEVRSRYWIRQGKIAVQTEVGKPH